MDPGSSPGRGTINKIIKRLWCNGNKSPCHGEVPGSIPGRRSTDTNSRSLVVGSSPVSVTVVESPS